MVLLLRSASTDTSMRPSDTFRARERVVDSYECVGNALLTLHRLEPAHHGRDAFHEWPRDVEAVEDSAFLLTIAGPG